MRPFLFLLTIAVLALSACAQVTKVEPRPFSLPPEDAHPSPIGFSGLQLKIPTGQDIGVVAADGGLFSTCGWPYYPAGREVIRSHLDRGDLKDVFHDTLEAQGYDITGNLDFNFPEDFEQEELRSEYKIGGQLVAVEMKACHQQTSLLLRPFGRLDSGDKGELYVKIKWSVYDALRRKVVYKTESEGYSDRRRANIEGVTLMINEAFAMAAHNLGADTDFHALIFDGRKPPEGWRNEKEHNPEDRPRLFEPDEAVSIPAQKLSTTAFTAHAEKTRKAVVMVQAGSGHGSGFFITPQGHILTNAHVVGNAMRVRIVTADKEEKLIAEVLRKDNARDVALLKLESTDGLNITILPVRTEWPAVSEQIYVIGAPLSTRLQDTVTGGIISSHRKNYKFLGSSQNLIQADVTTHGGNSGGPMVDRNGNLIGMVHGGINFSGGADAGLNMFIPIGEAMNILNIGFGGDAQNKTGAKDAPVPLH